MPYFNLMRTIKERKQAGAELCHDQLGQMSQLKLSPARLSSLSLSSLWGFSCKVVFLCSFEFILLRGHPLLVRLSSCLITFLIVHPVNLFFYTQYGVGESEVGQNIKKHEIFLPLYRSSNTFGFLHLWTKLFLPPLL